MSIDNFNREAIEFRRRIHMHPELSNQEYETTRKIKEKLKEWNIEIIETNLPTGVIACVGKGLIEKNIYIRADIDALPIKECTGELFTSRNEGISHACGHDIHLTTVLYTVRNIKTLENNIDGRVFFIFQPAEEVMEGAIKVINTGIFNKYPPSLILGVHTWPEIDAGKIGIKVGRFMAASDSIEIRIKGKGGHAAHPQKAIDPVVISAHIVLAIQSFISREIAATDSVVITIGKVTGGKVGNVIPDEVILEGSIRSADDVLRKHVQNRMKILLPAIAQGFGGDCEVNFGKGNPAVINDETIVAYIEKSAQEVLGEDNVVSLNHASMGSEDFSFYLEYCKGAMFRIGTGNEKVNSRQALHNNMLIFDEKSIQVGVRVLTQTIKNILVEQ